MNSRTPLFLLIAVFLWPFLALAQADSTLLEQFRENEKNAHQFTKMAMYQSAVAEWTKAIELAKSEGIVELYLDASISLAELLRKTGDFERALQMLTELETDEYPKSHVRKLGRMAAVYHEMEPRAHINKMDTVKFFINQALKLAVALNLKEEEASLKNELGFLLSRNVGPGEGLSLLLEASSIFKDLGDTLGYINTMTHLVNDYHDLGLRRKEDSTTKALVALMEGRNWYAAEIDLYNIIAQVALVRGDSSKYYRWAQKVDIATVNYYKAISNDQMVAFRILHDTKKYQEEAEASKTLATIKVQELEQQQVRTRNLTLYISLLGVLILLVAGLFIREKRLKAEMDHINQELHVANDKYQMLMVESNHRIKNNLQMVISMLRYSSKEMDGGNTKAFKRISSKIHTISALHKHLYLDAHNEKVAMDTYFNEIISLYEEIAPEYFTVKKAIEPVPIKSERIVYFGLIFNEMLSNTLEHQKKMHKSVNIEIATSGGQYLFRYYDGSVISMDDTKGMGSQLIDQLIRRVGGKNPVFDPSIGLYQFTFNV